MMTELPIQLKKWSFDFKLFKRKMNNNSINNYESKFLYTLTLAHHPSKLLTMGNLQESGVVMNIGNDSKHAFDNISSGISESFDTIIMSKLQNIWIFRQSLKSESGTGYEFKINNCKSNKKKDILRIRMANYFLRGTFRGFLIEIEYIYDDDKDLDLRYGIEQIQTMLTRYNFPRGRLCFGSLVENGEVVKKSCRLFDLISQYVEALDV